MLGVVTRQCRGLGQVARYRQQSCRAQRGKWSVVKTDTSPACAATGSQVEREKTLDTAWSEHWSRDQAREIRQVRRTSGDWDFQRVRE